MSTNKPLVSIALCLYNGEKFIKEQLDSIINQSYTNIEIVIVDDMSTDNSVEIVKAYLSLAKIRFYENESNLGFIKNFEKCLSLCNGEYIALSDQDDIWLPEKIEKLINQIGFNYLIYSDSLLIDVAGNSLQAKITDRRHFYRGDDPRPFIFSNCVSGHAILIKKSLVPFIFPFPENVFHDWWIAFVACSVGSIEFIPDVLVLYRQHNKSQTDFLDLKPKNPHELKNKAEFRINQLHHFVSWLSLLENFHFNKKKNQLFFQKLKKLYAEKINNYFSFHLLTFLLLHKGILFFCKKKTYASKLNFCFQQSIGFKSKLKFDKTYNSKL